MIAALTAISRALAVLKLYVRCMSSFTICPVSTELEIHVIIPEVQLFCLPMFWACLGHEDLMVPFKYKSGKNSVALGADALGLPYKVDTFWCFSFVKYLCYCHTSSSKAVLQGYIYL